MKLKDLTQTRIGGLHVSLDGDGKVTKEEAYFSFDFTWLGKRYHADATADRYLTSVWDNGTSENRLTDWRIIVRGRYDSPLTDAGRRAADAEIEPMVRKWIRSPEYIRARQNAYAYAITRAIGDERYNADRARQVLERHRHELTDDDRDRLTAACDLLTELLAALASVPQKVTA